jgi:hypothetical protein
MNRFDKAQRLNVYAAVAGWPQARRARPRVRGTAELLTAVAKDVVRGMQDTHTLIGDIERAVVPRQPAPRAPTAAARLGLPPSADSGAAIMQRHNIANARSRAAMIQRVRDPGVAWRARRPTTGL